MGMDKLHPSTAWQVTPIHVGHDLPVPFVRSYIDFSVSVTSLFHDVESLGPFGLAAPSETRFDGPGVGASGSPKWSNH